MANILIVDDSRTSRKILRNLLETEGHIIVGEATDGLNGIDKYNELQPDITTMDITMPNLDGIEALKRIISINPNAKVIMITAAGQANKVTDALKYGATEFLTKPFDPEQITKIIRNVLK